MAFLDRSIVFRYREETRKTVNLLLDKLTVCSLALSISNVLERYWIIIITKPFIDNGVGIFFVKLGAYLPQRIVRRVQVFEIFVNLETGNLIVS